MRHIRNTLLLTTSLLTLVSCGKGNVIETVTINNGPTYHSIGFYDETVHDELDGGSVFNHDLFYRNERKFGMADPAVIRITDKDSPDYGKFFVVGTTNATSGFDAFVSSDLATWQSTGAILISKNKSDPVYQCVSANAWAPEMIYDEDEKMYYLFFSATPRNAAKNSSFTTSSLPFVAKSNSPRGPFEMISHPDYLGYDGAPLPSNMPFAKYLTFDPYQFYATSLDLGLIATGTETSSGENLTFEKAIDFHPWVDPTDGTKYLYFKLEGPHYGEIFGVEMIDWNTPIYDTMTMVSRPNHATIDINSEPISFEVGTRVNEGPWVSVHNGNYYLTLSVNGYADRSYCVMQAVGKSALGPFRKLDVDEGGVLLSSDNLMRDDVSGTGHHSFIDIDGKTYIVYHKHDDTVKGGGERHIAVDEIRYLDITNKFGEPMEVMYCNGPTYSVQPKFEFASDYRNVATEATITATNVSSDSSASYLNDDILSINSFANIGFNENYIHETTFDSGTTITVDLAKKEKVRSLLVYNSKYMEDAFYKIKRVSFEVENNGVTEYKYFNDMKFDWESYTSTEDPDVIRPGSAAVAEFDEVETKKIIIEIDPATNDEIAIHGENGHEIGLSEIRVLARK